MTCMLPGSQKDQSIEKRIIRKRQGVHLDLGCFFTITSGTRHILTA